MHDGMPYGRIQGQGQGHEPIQGSSIENLQSREVDRQSPTGLIFWHLICLYAPAEYAVRERKFVCVQQRKVAGEVSGVEREKVIVLEAERLEIRDKAPLVLAELLYDSNIIAQIKQHRNLFCRVRCSDIYRISPVMGNLIIRK